MAKLRKHHQVVVSTRTVARAIKGLHYSFKRVHKVAERVVLPGLKEDRKIYAERFLQLKNEYVDDAIIFFAEVGFEVKMRVAYGQSPVGERVVKVVPALRSRNISIVCVMTRKRIVGRRAMGLSQAEKAFSSTHLSFSSTQNLFSDASSLPSSIFLTLRN